MVLMKFTSAGLAKFRLQSTGALLPNGRHISSPSIARVPVFIQHFNPRIMLAGQVPVISFPESSPRDGSYHSLFISPFLTHSHSPASLLRF